MRRVMVAVVGLALAGCSSGVQYVMSEYTGIESKPFAIEGDDVYRVFDNVPKNKLMITPSIGKAMAMGAGSGATFGAIDTSAPKPVYERAALAYLESTGRRCRMVDGYLLVNPQWEFKYDCSMAPSARR